jgi:hypothetical protein
MISPAFFYGIFISDPLLSDGAVSGNWVLVAALAIVGFFLIRFMNQVDTLVKQVSTMQVTQEVMKRELDTMSKQMQNLAPDKIAEEAVAKLLILQGGTGGRHWPFNRKDQQE